MAQTRKKLKSSKQRHTQIHRNIPENVLDDLANVGRGDTLAQPRALHLLCRHRPHLEVVRTHEDIRNALAHHAQNPLVEVLGRGGGHGVVDSGLDQAVDAVDLVLERERDNVVLERIRHPGVSHPAKYIHKSINIKYRSCAQ